MIAFYGDATDEEVEYYVILFRVIGPEKVSGTFSSLQWLKRFLTPFPVSIVRKAEC